MRPDPRNPGKHIDPSTGIWPMSEWGYECQRGFVRHEMFSRGADRVIAGTNRASQRKWRDAATRIVSPAKGDIGAK